MAPSLRKSTVEKSRTSKKLRQRREANARAKSKSPRPRHRVYKLKNGLISMKTPKELQHITIANSTNSPLLRMPPEIRTQIFKHAISGPPINIKCIHCNGNCQDIKYVSTTGKYHGLHLPSVCRQVYSETATMVYAENAFRFWREKAMFAWISNRLPAQRKAISRLNIPYGGSPEAEVKVKKLCPHVKSVHPWGWLSYYGGYGEAI